MYRSHIEVASATASQWGAKDMADKGKDAAEILAFYYRGADVTLFTH
ncbi:MAG: hypothetical protein HY699_06055 [Deltaproteobacteria bacterium]|nr:hypothetical protein [Deltaproteobacteria bacterium]